MDNRFTHMDRELRSRATAHRTMPSRSLAVLPPRAASRTLSATDRALVILIENGGVDLGIDALVDMVLEKLPSQLVTPDLRRKIVDAVRTRMLGATDQLIEDFELSLNRYQAAAPEHFGQVVVLRDGTASASELRDTLRQLTEEGKTIDLFILTHGRDDYISVTGGIDSARIRQMRADVGRPLRIRVVYMMNCVGGSLNQAWVDAGAKASAGSKGNNYLPEPTMFFFWQRWKAGDSFQDAVMGAYGQTVTLLRTLVHNLLPSPLNIALLSLPVAEWGFVEESAPVIAGQPGVTISSDSLTFAQSLPAGMGLTLRSLSADGPADGDEDGPSAAGGVSPHGMELIRRWEGDDDGLADRIDTALSTVRRAVEVPLTQDERDALVSFVTSIGRPAFERSTLLAMLNAGERAEVPEELRKWVNRRTEDGGTTVDDALVERRAAEAELFDRQRAATAQSLLRATTSWPLTVHDRDHYPQGGPGCGLAMTLLAPAPSYSRGMWDTGEHVAAGERALGHKLRLGGGGVEATYGEVVAMGGDLFESVRQMQSASAAELNRILAQVRRSHQVKTGQRRGPGPGTKQWQEATGGRYAQLAERNNAHFAPHGLLLREPGRGTVGGANHKAVWHDHHARAVAKASELHLQHSPATPAQLNDALVINAFGDHFLTDAFAAGHLFNKEAFVNVFRHRFYTGGDVNDAAEAFLARLAERAFRGKVKSRFSRLEPKHRPRVLGPFRLPWRPNIDSTDMFGKVLMGIAQEEPRLTANLAAKALHDRLNRTGVRVTNDNNDVWTAFGDSHVDQFSLDVMRHAVGQSAANVLSEELSRSSPDVTQLQAAVWGYTPRPIETERHRLGRMVRDFTDPASDDLVEESAAVIAAEVDTLIDELKKRGKLRDA